MGIAAGKSILQDITNSIGQCRGRACPARGRGKLYSVTTWFTTFAELSEKQSSKNSPKRPFLSLFGRGVKGKMNDFVALDTPTKKRSLAIKAA